MDALSRTGLPQASGRRMTYDALDALWELTSWASYEMNSTVADEPADSSEGSSTGGGAGATVVAGPGASTRVEESLRIDRGRERPAAAATRPPWSSRSRHEEDRSVEHMRCPDDTKVSVSSE